MHSMLWTVRPIASNASVRFSNSSAHFRHILDKFLSWRTTKKGLSKVEFSFRCISFAGTRGGR